MKNQTNNKFLFSITMVAALGGLLFGYDTAVISGAIGNLSTYFELSSAETGWAASSALIGCVLGAIFASYFSFKFGRQVSMIIAAILFFISAVGSGLAGSFTEFIIYRIVGGVGVGLASMLAPMYIAEIAPSDKRGELVSLNQLAIVIGMLVVYLVNYNIAILGDATWNLNVGWRWMFASEAIPALAYFVLLFFVPKSPRWLAVKNRYDEAKRTLIKINGAAQAENIINDIKNSLKEKKGTWRDLAKPSLRWALVIGLGLSIFQQITGINVILYYAPEILKGFGSGSNTALLQTILIGATNLIFTIIAIKMVDKVGRKKLLIIGTIGMAIPLITIGFGAYLNIVGAWLLPFLLCFTGAFAVSWGPVVWVMLSEIFPNSVRSLAMAIAVLVQWLANFAISQTFPMLDKSPLLQNYFNGGFPFWLYGTMCILALAFVWFLVPETKNKTLEEMDNLWKVKLPQE